MNPSGLLAAIQAGDAEGVRILLADDPSLAAARDESGSSVLMQCLCRNNRKMVDLLLACGCEQDIFEASSTGDAARVNQLLQQNPDLIHASSADGFTPLHFACYFAQEKIVPLLLARGAAADAVSRNPMLVKPIHSAAVSRNIPIMQALLAHGASPNVKQHLGWTALHAAAQNGDRTMVELLLKYGANRSARNDEGITPGALAAKQGHTEIEKLLG